MDISELISDPYEWPVGSIISTRAGEIIEVVENNFDIISPISNCKLKIIKSKVIFSRDINDFLINKDISYMGGKIKVTPGDYINILNISVFVVVDENQDYYDYCNINNVKIKSIDSIFNSKHFNYDIHQLFERASSISNTEGNSFDRRYPEIFLSPGTYVLDKGIKIGAGQSADLDGLILRAVPGTVRIIVAPDVDAITIFGAANKNIHIEGITFYGGRRHVRLPGNGTTTNVRKVIRDCSFVAYSLSAISCEQSDSPHWEIQGNTFLAAEGAEGSVGIALGGLLDNSSIIRNRFFRNWIDIIIDGDSGLGVSGSITIENNDFVHFGNLINKRSNIWIIPADKSTGSNSGYGSSISNNKFGGENYDSGWSRVLVAMHAPTEGGARDQLRVDERFFTARSVNGFRLNGNRWSSYLGASGEQLIVECWIGKIGSWIFQNNYLNTPGNAIKFMGDGAPDAGMAPWFVQGNCCEGSGLYTVPWQVSFCNHPIATIDAGEEGLGGADIRHMGPIDGGYLEAPRTPAALIPTRGPTRRSVVYGSDIYGGDDLAEFELKSASAGIAQKVPLLRGRAQVVAQIDLCTAPERSCRFVQIEFCDGAAGLIVSRQIVELTDFPQTFELRALLSAGVSWQFRVSPRDWQGQDRERFRAGRLIGPIVTRGGINGGHIRTHGSGSWNGAHLIMGSYHIWIDANGQMRIKHEPPSHDLDGSAFSFAAFPG